MLAKRTLVVLCSLATLGVGPAPASAADLDLACSSDDLVPVAVSTEGTSHHFVLRNSGGACTLAEQPAATLYRGSRRLPIRLHNTAMAAPDVLHVPAGAMLAFGLTTTRAGCVTADRVEVDLVSSSVVFGDLSIGVCRGAAVQQTPFKVALAH
jgi:hypothetical protein